MKASVRVDLSGLDKFKRKLEQIAKPRNVPIAELLTPDFVRRHSRFASVDELHQAFGPLPAGQNDLAAGEADLAAQIASPEWDAFIARETPFASWGELLQAAGAEYYQRQLR